MGAPVKRLRELAWIIGFMVIVPPSLVARLEAQTFFPVLAVDTSVRNRLAEEWQPFNRYQTERGYCVTYTVQSVFTNQGPVTLYTLTRVERAIEDGATTSGIRRLHCFAGGPNVVLLHTHPPTTCDDEMCSLGGAWANQCYPSPTDMHTLNIGDKPFELLQCDRNAIVPVWRTRTAPVASAEVGAQ